MDAKNQAVHSIFSGLLPSGSPRALRRLIQLSLGSPQEFDLVREGQDGDINNVQAIFVDNADNASAVTIEFPGTQHRVVLPPQWQGILPVFGSANMRLKLTSTGGIDLPIHLLNVPLPFTAWPTIANSASVTVTVPTGSFTDRSGVGTGVDQTLAPTNATRKRLMVQNSNGNSNPMYLNFGAAAAFGNSFEIFPGDTFDTTAGPVSTQAVHILASNGEAYIAKEM